MLFISSLELRLYEFRFVWVQKYVGYEQGTICAHWNADYLLENLFLEDHENIVDYKLQHLNDFIFNVLVFRISVPRPKTKILYLWFFLFHFLWIKEFRIIVAFKLLVRNGCVKGRKFKGLDASDMVEIWRLKMF